MVSINFISKIEKLNLMKELKKDFNAKYMLIKLFNKNES